MWINRAPSHGNGLEDNIIKIPASQINLYSQCSQFNMPTEFLMELDTLKKQNVKNS